MRIIILGGGAFGSAFANQLSRNPKNEVTLLVRDQVLKNEISNNQTNKKYLPNKILSKTLKVSTDLEVMKKAHVIFIALPSSVIALQIDTYRKYINEGALVVNLSKGIFEKGLTIVDFLRNKLKKNEILTMKGASFASEMTDNTPTLFTLGYNVKKDYDIINSIIESTNIYIDSTKDIKGVEILSALKNIYAIFSGNIDAKYNSANTRFMILTKSFSEIRILLKFFGGQEETLFLSAGFGDICLTSLNDLSRNRTLGLLIGKGFYNSKFTDNSVILEGVKAIEMINANLPNLIKKELPIFRKVHSFFNKEVDNLNVIFSELMKSEYKTVLTYGTFDLLHYGHVEILRRAKQLGNRLIVGLSTDAFNLSKGKKCEISYEKRKQLLESIGYVDYVIPEESWDQKALDIKNHNVDVFVMGDDWKGKFDDLNKYCQVHYFARTKGISTTKLKSILDK